MEKANQKEDDPAQRLLSPFSPDDEKSETGDDEEQNNTKQRLIGYLAALVGVTE